MKDATKQTHWEPDLLNVFRLFTGLYLGLISFGYLSRLIFHGPPQQFPAEIFWLSFITASMLLVYLSWPMLQRMLGSFYLPLALLVISISPIIQQNMILRLQIPRGLALPLVGVWQLMPVLFIPLVLIGWQYNFRTVLLFCLGTAFLDWGLTLAAVNTSPVQMPPIFILPIIGAIVVRTVSFILVGYMVVRLMTTQREQRKALAQANVQLAHYAATLEQLATSRERNRLARELHDTLAHSLSGVAVQLEGVKTLWDTDPGGARAMLDQSLAATRSGLTETRRALQALRASPLEDLGLALAIRSLAESTAARNGLALEVEVPDNLNNLPPDVEQSIYRVAQEALENVTRHAQAQHVKVKLAQENSHVELDVSDDGRGFELQNVDLIEQYGLQGMRERSIMMGGELKVESQPGGGTTVRLTWGGKK